MATRSVMSGWDEYTVESGATKTDIRRIVRKMMKNGWQPIGGICIDLHEDEARYLQAMVRIREQK
tara:strand:+ start:466 stop:660 length:195 start_codon:yes stop_codon:yes gene_type:complete